MEKYGDVDANFRSSKIENFIRTKYESKRWVMDDRDPAIIDPKTLDDEGDDDVVCLDRFLVGSLR